MNSKINEVSTLADTRESFSFMLKFSADELAARKDELSIQVIDQQRITEEIKRLTTPLKEKLKSIKQTTNELCDQIRQKGEYVTELCFVHFDQESGKAKYYSETTGEEVYSRPLTAGERQLTISYKKAMNE